MNPDGSRALVNGTQTGSIKAYQSRTVPEPSLPVAAPTLTVTTSGGNVTIAWDGAGTLQESTTLTAWTDVVGSTNPFTTPANQPAKFYRVRN